MEGNSNFSIFNKVKWNKVERNSNGLRSMKICEKTIISYDSTKKVSYLGRCFLVTQSYYSL